MQIIKHTLLILTLLLSSHVQATTFTVINTNDSGAGSLRQAILDANTAGGNCTINFNIPGAAPHIITPTTFNSTTPPRAQVYEPLMNNNIIMDATTQPGFAFGNPSIIIDCTTIATTGNSGSCFFIQGASYCTIKGFGICNYVGSLNGYAISIENTATTGSSCNKITQCVLGTISAVPPFGNTRGIVMSSRFAPTGSNAITNNIIGGPLERDGNILSGNSIAGIALQSNANSNMIEHNFIGCDATGTMPLGNAFGIVAIGSPISGSASGPCNNNIIQNNVISGNTTQGIVLQGAANGNVVYHNKVGTDITGSFLVGTTAGAGIGLSGDATDTCNENLIQSNVVSGNIYGISLNSNCSFNQIVGNTIGTNRLGADLGNSASGILIQGTTGLPCSNNVVSSNTIKYNGNGAGAADFYGIYLNSDSTTPDVSNALLENNIFSNNNNGIELSNNGNDMQAAPTINTATLNKNILTVSITAPATPAVSNFRLELFSNAFNANPITEGSRFVGAVVSVPSGQTVTQSFVVAYPPIYVGNYLSATATNLNNAAGLGDTSEYSLNTIITRQAGC